MRDGSDLCFSGQCLLELVKAEITVIVNIDPFQHRALALAQKVPGHDIGMMLHNREYNLIAFLYESLAKENPTEFNGFVADFVKMISLADLAFKKARTLS